MKKAARIFLIVLGIIAIVLAGFAAFIALRGIPSYKAQKVDLKLEASPATIEKGAQLSAMLCNDCHMDENTGKLTGRKMDEIDQFGAVYAKNITQDPESGIGKWSNGQIAYLLRTGIAPDGKFLPIMAKLSKMSDEDLNSIIAFLRSEHKWVQPDNTTQPESKYSFLTKFLTNIKAMEPMPFPTGSVPGPDTTNLVKWGEYVALHKVECYACHSKDFAKNNYSDPPKSEGYFGGGNGFKLPDGGTIYSKNITMDEETGIGKWSEEEFIKAVKYGQVTNKPALRMPMKPYTHLSDNEVRAIFAYLKTIPKIKNKVDN
ncbi:MAG TPA: c-type cytochrome [Chitinophagaceae bacterium]|nr:c-type cytochrome [Chitinophagaceae bacterium]